MRHGVLVTGAGAVTALGVGVGRLLDRWSAGDNGIADSLGACREFRPRDFIPARDERRTTRLTQMAIAACDEAVAGAGWGACVPFDPYRVACVLATAYGAIDATQSQHHAYLSDGADACAAHALTLMAPDAAAAALTTRYGLHGPSSTVVSACAAGADAVASGARMIRSGEVDAAIVGGAESAISSFARCAITATGSVSPTGVCRPFDARHDGFVIGEGAGILVLESEAAAAARGATGLAWLRGVGVSSDAFHPTAPDPGSEAAARAIEVALEDAGIGPEDVDYVNAHGTGVPREDRAETRALKAALKTRAHSVPVSSAKSAIGHLLGAAGAVEALATVLALRHGVAPPTVGYAVSEEQLDLDYNADARALDVADRPAIGISNSFGFGGHNVVLAFEAKAAA